MRNGAWTAEMPTFTGKVAAREPFLVRDWEVAQAATNRPVKITVPGPLTIADSTANVFYANRRSWCADLAEALNVEIRRLAEAGCRHIQVDEPLFARLPDQALDFGVENLERCFHGVPGSVTRTMRQKSSVIQFPQRAYPSDPGLTTCWVSGCHRRNVRLMFCNAQPLEVRPPDVPRRLRGALSR